MEVETPSDLKHYLDEAEITGILRKKDDIILAQIQKRKMTKLKMMALVLDIQNPF